MDTFSNIFHGLIQLRTALVLEGIVHMYAKALVGNVSKKRKIFPKCFMAYRTFESEGCRN